MLVRRLSPKRGRFLAGSDIVGGKGGGKEGGGEENFFCLFVVFEKKITKELQQEGVLCLLWESTKRQLGGETFN